MGWKLVVLEPLLAKFLVPNLTAPSSSTAQLGHPPSPLHLLQISIFLIFFSEPGLQPRAGNKRNYLVSPHFSSSAWGLIKAKWKTQRSSTGFWYRPTTCGRERGKNGGKKNIGEKKSRKKTHPLHRRLFNLANLPGYCSFITFPLKKNIYKYLYM